jgi:hypothetical protein
MRRVAVTMPEHPSAHEFRSRRQTRSLDTLDPKDDISSSADSSPQSHHGSKRSKVVPRPDDAGLLTRVFGQAVLPETLKPIITELGSRSVSLQELTAVFCGLGRDQHGCVPRSELEALAEGRRFCATMHARTTLRAALFGCKFTSMKGERDDAGSKSNLNGGAISFEAFCSCVLAVVNPRGGRVTPEFEIIARASPGGRSTSDLVWPSSASVA